MAPAVAVADPEELLTVFGEEKQVIDAGKEIKYVNPGIGAFFHYQPALSGNGITEEQLKMILRSIQMNNSQLPFLGSPVQAWNVAVFRSVHPLLFGRLHIDDSNFYAWVFIAYLWVGNLFVFRMVSFIIGHLKDMYIPLVGLPVGNIFAVGRPPPGLHQSEFFLINPPKAAVIKILFAAVGQPGLFVSSYVIHKKIALSFITNLRTIR